MEQENPYGPYVEATEASRQSMDELGITREDQDLVYRALARSAEKLAETNRWLESWEFRPLPVGRADS